MNLNYAWSGLADARYWDYIAKYCVPSWHKLPGKKFLVSDSADIGAEDVALVEYASIENKESKFLARSKKVHNFWRKMQSQVWAAKTLCSDYDIVVLLDTDIEVLDFNLELFEQEVENFLNSGLIWATGESQRGSHDSGVIMLDTHHADLFTLFDEYENIWESGLIDTLDKAYDGNAVESLLPKYPSYKIKNTDCGKGLHLYDLGLVHWGSKEPKEQRAAAESAESLIKQRLAEKPLKTYKNRK